MESSIRHRLRSAGRQDGVASEDDARSHKSTASSTTGSRSVGGSSSGGTSCTMVRHESTASLAAFFDNLDDGTGDQLMSDKQSEPTRDVGAPAEEASGLNDKEVDLEFSGSALQECVMASTRLVV